MFGIDVLHAEKVDPFRFEVLAGTNLSTRF